MLSDKIEAARKSRLNYLNDNAVLGKYDFFTTVIWLDAVEMRHLEELLKHHEEIKRAIENGLKNLSFELYTKISTLLPLTFHEYTHYIDCTSTLWGLKLLSLMDEAYSILNNPKPEDEAYFFRAKKFFDTIKNIRLPAYYTEIGDVDAKPKTWNYRISIGKKFDFNGVVTDEPILFVRFIDSQNNLIARSPISTLSILECSSTAQEIAQRVMLIANIDNSDARAVEQRQYEQDLLREVYSKDLTEYSVCAHLLANVIQEPDIPFVYSCAGILCRIALNFPDVLFDKLVGEKLIDSQIFRGVDEVESSLYIGLKNKDLGVLYYVFCETARLNKIDMRKEPIDWVEDILHGIGISLTEVKNMAKKQIVEAEFKISTIHHIHDAGVSNFNKIDWFQRQLNMDELILPPAYLGDMEFINPFSGKGCSHYVQTLNVEELFDEMHAYEQNVHKFAEACG